jgi:fermentation-respiration switch protein FrsA (DUF1100 family)
VIQRDAVNDLSHDAPDTAARTAGTKSERRRFRSVVRVAIVFVLAYLLVVAFMMGMENSLIFFPSVYPDGYWNPPGLAFEDAWFRAADTTKLHGWYVPHDRPRAVVLFAHGNAGNLSHRWDLLESLQELGVAAMIFDYRGYGRSEGSPSETGVLDDARAARHWLAQRAGIDESEIVLMGESLGGAVMVDLAAKDGARALVLESTFTSLPDVAAYHYPWLPVRLFMRARLDAAAKIGNYRGPLLQFHGDADTIIPCEIGRRLFQAAREPKEFVTLVGHDHNDPRPPEFFVALDRFLAHLPGR